LHAERLLDDRRYVENFVAYHAARGQGPVKVRQGLRDKGLRGELVEDCLRSYGDWLKHLKEARRKKFGANPPDDFAARQRQMRFLGYRGFTSAQIRTALGFDIDIDSDNQAL
jgi:regulatory protein